MESELIQQLQDVVSTLLLSEDCRPEVVFGIISLLREIEYE